MQTSHLLRHQMIIGLAEPDAEKMVDAAIERWEQMASQIISIIGEGGFNSLSERSVILTQATFPWLLSNALQSSADHRFIALKASLEGQTASLAIEANRQLLITFTDILASLIGEQLTTRILRSAWGHKPQPLIDKEI